jgi:hypothetical protein
MPAKTERYRFERWVDSIVSRNRIKRSGFGRPCQAP